MKYKFTAGVVLSTIVLLFYSYLLFMGMLYRGEGDIKKAILISLGVFAVVTACVTVMVFAKVKKNKATGSMEQIAFGIALLTLFGVSGTVVSGFLSAVGNKAMATKAIEDVTTAVCELDTDYEEYVATRVTLYRESLPKDSVLKVQSLERRLLLDNNLDEYKLQRQEWVNDLGQMSLWNVKLPNNLKIMDTCVMTWAKDYETISSVVYEDEPSSVMPFKYKKFSNAVEGFFQICKKRYSVWAILLVVFATLMMMVPYWFADAPKTREKGEIKWVVPRKNDN